jgi:mannose-6-phosphate isomerase-like protein (cupin superfamily)
MSTSPSRNLASTFVVIKPDHSALPVAVTPDVFEALDARFDNFKNHLLVSTFDFDHDWASWEMHAAGDEIVSLLSGEVTMVLEREGAEEAVLLVEPGSFVIIPKGTWHTARTAVPTRMLFVTPGEGTQNRPL